MAGVQILPTLLLVSLVLVGPVRYHVGDWPMTATVTAGKFWRYVEGTVQLPEPWTEGLLLIGVGTLANKRVKVAPLSWHHFGRPAAAPIYGPPPTEWSAECRATKGLVPGVGLVSVSWRNDGAGPPEMRYVLSVPKWLDGLTIRWQVVTDRGGGRFWVSDAWAFTGGK